jgi:leucyl aminopeptidase
VLYRFTEMKSGRKPPAMPLKKVGMAVASRGDAAKSMRGARHGDAIVSGMSLAKDLGNLPPNVCTPSYIARAAQKLSREHKNLHTRVLNETEMKRLGMHSLLSVTAGTKEPAKLIVMQYKGKAGKRPIVLVGKGVTFDAGGISLKPGPGMDEMKFDMCGAAGVIGTMAAVAKLQLPINLIVVVPTVENMPSGKATRPGDIVKSMSGQTIEVLNTDAEGRLILCDALTYSRRFKPDAIIDVATLTGACVVALGHHRTAVMSNNDDLSSTIVAAGVSSDDRGWPMPLGEEWADQLKSNFADMANVGGRDGGAITAACFLSKFTDGMNWAHLDIAGTAWKSGKEKGATGRPVPMLTEFLLGCCGALP